LRLATLLPSRRAAGMLVGLAILAALLLLYDPRDVADQLQSVRWSIAVPAMLGLTLIHLLQVEVWRQLSLRLAGRPLPRLGASIAYYAGQAVGVVTPANLGADFYRAFSLKNASGSWNGVVAPIVAQRALSALALVVLAAASLLVKAPLVLDLNVAARAAVVGLVAAVALAFAGQPVLAAAAGHLPGRIKAVGKPDFRAFFLPFLLAILFHAGSVLLAFLLVLSVHANAPLFATVSLLLLARLATLLPITPYGLGFQEASLALLLPTVGLSQGAALAVSVLNRLAMLLTAGIGISALGISALVDRKGGPAQARAGGPVRDVVST
jgi:uncharacterized membrane protein YbhN (UPF0104 family)